MTLSNSDFTQINTLIVNALKENNKELVSKADLVVNNKQLVSKSDLVANNKSVFKGIFDYIAKTCATKQDIARLEENISHLPKKEEFYKKMDKWMKAMTDKPAEKTAHKSRHNRTDKRLETIEDHLGIVSI